MRKLGHWSQNTLSFDEFILHATYFRQFAVFLSRELRDVVSHNTHAYLILNRTDLSSLIPDLPNCGYQNPGANQRDGEHRRA